MTQKQIDAELHAIDYNNIITSYYFRITTFSNVYNFLNVTPIQYNFDENLFPFNSYTIPNESSELDQSYLYTHSLQRCWTTPYSLTSSFLASPNLFSHCFSSRLEPKNSKVPRKSRTHFIIFLFKYPKDKICLKGCQTQSQPNVLLTIDHLRS